MIRPSLAALALLAALSACANDYGDTQACAQPEVLHLVSDRLRKAGLPQQLETQAIGQAPGPTPGIVLCAIWVHRLVYNTSRVGEKPTDTLVAYQYQLQIRRNAAFLLPDPALTSASR